MSKKRMTRQKQAILEELRKTDSHPTADEIYERVRQKLPHISLGTVYRNLETLSKSGLVKKLDIGGPQKRFDGEVESHYHARCLNCDRIDDLFVSTSVSMEDIFRDSCDYQITGHQLVLFGLCPECKKRRNINGTKRIQD